MRRVGSLVLVFGLLVSACGDDSGSDDAADTTEDGSSSDATVDLDDLESAFGSEECAEAAAAMAAAIVGVSSAFSGQADDLDESIEQLAAAADAAPDEIKDDLETIATGYREFMEAFEDAGFDPSSGDVPDADTIAALEAASAELDEEAFQDAADRVNAFFEDGCED